MAALPLNAPRFLDPTLCFDAGASGIKDAHEQIGGVVLVRAIFKLRQFDGCAIDEVTCLHDSGARPVVRS